MNEFRPRLNGNKDVWENIIDKIREITPEKAYSVLCDIGQIKYDSQKRTYLSNSQQIKTLQNLIEQANIDETKWEIWKHEINKWDTTIKDNDGNPKTIANWQVKAWLRLNGLEPPSTNYTDSWLSNLFETFKIRPYTPTVIQEGDTLVVVVSDLHIGYLAQDMKLVADYNSSVVAGHLDYIANYVNNFNKNVVVVLTGDYIESFTGKNKKDTWKQIEKSGSEVALMAVTLLQEFFQKIKYLNHVYMVAGNHDRVTESKDDDPDGQVAHLIYSILNKYVGIPITFDYLILNPIIDGIQYIITHGNNLIKTKNISDLVFDYGDNKLFNLIISGHLHSRQILADRLKYRSIITPPILSGTKYEERNNWNSLSGFTIIENHEKKNVPKILDIPL